MTEKAFKKIENGLVEVIKMTELQAEIERLNKALLYEEARTGRIGTHAPNCWSWGPSHYECALRHIATLEGKRNV